MGIIVFIIGIILYPVAYVIGIVAEICIGISFIGDLVGLIVDASKTYDMELNNGILTCSVLRNDTQIPANSVCRTKYSWGAYTVWYTLDGNTRRFSFNPRSKSEIFEFDAMLRQQGNLQGQMEI